MKAKELRLSNLVYWDGKTIHNVYKVESIYKDGIDLEDNIYTNINSISPIPLTEEWLVKFGFELKETSIDNEYKRYYNKIGDGYHVCIDKLGATLHQSIEGELEYVTCLIIKYVHQLQNLVFALTGEELELK